MSYRFDNALLLSLALMLISLGTVGCQSAFDDGERISQNILPTECKPSEGFDTCEEVDLKEAQTWQEMAESGEADKTWRTVQPSETEWSDYEVTIDLEALNGGFIPTAKGQGHYESEEEFIHVANEELLGVPSDADVLLRVKGGGTAKLVEDRSAISTDSTGDFLVDALSDAEGNIYIADELRNDVLSASDPDDVEIVNNHEETSSSSLEIARSEISQTLSGGDYTAKQRAFASNYTIVSVTGGAAKNIKKNGKKCRWTWKIWKGFRECYKANYIKIYNEYNNGGSFIFSDGDDDSNTKKFRIDFVDWHWGPRGHSGIDGVCSVADVEFPNGAYDDGHLCDEAEPL